MKSMPAFSFLSFCGWFVRAGLIGTPFLVILDDFGKNRRFPGFGSADGREITIKMYVCMLFLSICGWSARAGLIKFARDFNFVRKAMISRSRFDSVLLVLLLGWNFRWFLVILAKIDDFPVSVQRMGTASPSKCTGVCYFCRFVVVLTEQSSYDSPGM